MISIIRFQKFSFFLIFLLPFMVFAQDPDAELYRESCTSITAGRLATDDGSVITAHTCDAYYRTWLQFVPAQKFERDTTHKVFWGTMHTHTAWSLDKVELKGEIPEAKSTFAYLNTAYPCINEKQLAMGETTISGRKELKNEKGLFLIEELERIALQRCTTARDAIKLIGNLIKDYGYGDSGECITIADKHEVWQLEVFGEGPEQVGGVWAAQRIPDDQIGISANICRIAEIKTDQPDYFMYSENVFEVARKMNFWDGEKPFKYWEAFGGNEKPFNIREYFVLSTLAPGLNLKYDSPELPFSVKPEKKLSPRDVMKFFRETYEGTRWDMTKDLMVTVKEKDKEGNVTESKVKSPVMNNWMSTDLIERQRTIAITGCSYSHVIQCRDWLPEEVGAVAWFSFDNPGQSPRIPIFSGVLKLPESFNICGQERYRTDAAIWSFREANRLATVNWSKGRQLIEPAVQEFENKAFEEMPVVEKKVIELVSQGKKEDAKKYVTEYTNNFAAISMKRWEEIKVTLWGMFGRGF